MNATTNNEEANCSDNMNWKLVSSGETNTPLRKAKQHEHRATSESSGDGQKRKNSSVNDDGGFKSKVTSRTVEVRFVTDPVKRSSFNLWMRLREFIKEAQVMDPSFRIMPLEGAGGECINQAKDWPNTKEGIDIFYRHWSRPNNISGKMKIAMKLSLVQLKLTSGTFIASLRRRGVHMNYAQLGVFNTVTLGWVTGAHPSYSYHDEMKERLGKLMTVEHKDLQYAFFPRSFHYIMDKNKTLTTRGIALQIIKKQQHFTCKVQGGYGTKIAGIEE
jgi:hypothetical protein